MSTVTFRSQLEKLAMNRFPTTAAVSSKLLGESLKFPNGRVAPNRLLKAAMTEKLCTYDRKDYTKHGLPTEALLNVYDKWGHGGFGMILTGNVQVHPENLEAIGNAIVFKEGETQERKALFSRWAQRAKSDGALAIVQVSHAGRQTPIYINPTPSSASDVQLLKNQVNGQFGKPVPMTTEQVKSEVIDRFVYTAKFLHEAGFDGIQLHAAHGYLLSQFTSPTTNKRSDKYGGSVENRNRLILEIYDEVRKAIPASTGFLVGIKTNSVEFQSEGTTVDDAKQMCEEYEKRGFDFVELSGGNYENFGFVHTKESTRIRESFFIEFAEKIRPVFKNTVVYLTGGFRTVGAMVDAVNTNATQGIGLGSPSTGEPDLAKKLLNGSVHSALKAAFKPEQMGFSVLACGSQIEQLGRKSVKSAGGNVMDQLSDFTDEKVCDRYGGAVGAFFQEFTQALQEGKTPKSVIVF